MDAVVYQICPGVVGLRQVRSRTWRNLVLGGVRVAAAVAALHAAPPLRRLLAGLGCGALLPRASSLGRLRTRPGGGVKAGIPTGLRNPLPQRPGQIYRTFLNSI